MGRDQAVLGVSDATGVSATAMIEALIDGERRGAVLLVERRACADCWEDGRPVDGPGRAVHRSPRADVPGWTWTASRSGEAVAGDAEIAPWVACDAREAALLEVRRPGSGRRQIVAGWLGALSPAQHAALRHRPAACLLGDRLPGNDISAKKSKGGRRLGDGGNYIKLLLVQAAWAAVRVPAGAGRFHRLVRRFGGARNKGAIKRAIMAIADILPKDRLPGPRGGQFAGSGEHRFHGLRR